MAKNQPIDYNKFSVEVYTPEGVLLQKAQINALHQFFASGLVPGYVYFVVFSYDEILIEILLFSCDETGKVVYLSPAHILYNGDVYIPPKTFLNGVKSKLKKRQEYNVPHMRWAKRALDSFIHSTHASGKKRRKGPKHALDAFIESTHEGAKRLICPKEVVAFKAGADLASKVK